VSKWLYEDLVLNGNITYKHSYVIFTYAWRLRHIMRDNWTSLVHYAKMAISKLSIKWKHHLKEFKCDIKWWWWKQWYNIIGLWFSRRQESWLESLDDLIADKKCEIKTLIWWRPSKRLVAKVPKAMVKNKWSLAWWIMQNHVKVWMINITLWHTHSYHIECNWKMRKSWVFNAKWWSSGLNIWELWNSMSYWIPSPKSLMDITQAKG
jgi:hypothetical protein